MEGKECRFGVGASALFATVTTDTSCGAVNSMHDSFMPLGGLVPLVNMQLGEIVFGGVGSGLYGMIVFVVLTVFIAGLMVGRTPEYLGKKIERREVQFAILAALVTPVLCAGSDGDRGGDARRSGDAEQRGAARLLRDPLRVHVDERQQRVGLCRPRAEPVLQSHDRRQHDVRPLCRGDSGARAGGRARRKESDPRRPPARSRRTRGSSSRC